MHSCNGICFLIRAFIRTFIWNFLNLWLSGRNYSVVLLKFTGLQFTLSICIKVTECPSLKEHTARNNQEHFRCICSTRQSYHSHMRHNYFFSIISSNKIEITFRAIYLFLVFDSLQVYSYLFAGFPFPFCWDVIDTIQSPFTFQSSNSWILRCMPLTQNVTCPHVLFVNFQ